MGFKPNPDSRGSELDNVTLRAPPATRERGQGLRQPHPSLHKGGGGSTSPVIRGAKGDTENCTVFSVTQPGSDTAGTQTWVSPDPKPLLLTICSSASGEESDHRPTCYKAQDLGEEGAQACLW